MVAGFPGLVACLVGWLVWVVCCGGGFAVWVGANCLFRWVGVGVVWYW